MGMGSAISDLVGVNVDTHLQDGLQNISNQISEGAKSIYKQVSDGLDHVRIQLSEQLGFSVDVAGFVQHTTLAMGVIIDGMAHLDWNKVGEGATALSHDIGQLMVQTNPFNSYWLFLSQGKAVSNVTAHSMMEVDKFFGNAITGAINFTTLPARGLRGDAITGDEIIHDTLSAIAVALIIIIGPGNILGALWSGLSWLGATAWAGIHYAWVGLLKLVEWITGKSANDVLAGMIRGEISKDGAVPAPGPGLVAPPGATTASAQDNRSLFAILGVGAAGLILWSIT